MPTQLTRPTITRKIGACPAFLAFRDPARIARFLALILCVGIGLADSPIAAKADAASDHYSLPEIKTWKAILATLNSPDGRITIDIIEKNFHTTLTPNPWEPPSTHPTDFIGLDGLDHLVQLALAEPSPPRWLFTVGWVHDDDIPPGRLNMMVAPKGTCVPSEMVETDLRASGWRETNPLRRSDEPNLGPWLPSAGFNKGPDGISIFFSKDYRCMAGLTAGNYP